MINILNKAINLHKLGKLNEAKNIYKELLINNPGNFQLINLLGILSLQLKDVDNAVFLLNKAIKLNPNDASIYCNLGTAYLEAKKNNEAITNFKKAIEINPSYAEAYNNLGITLKKINQYEEAHASYKIAIKLKSNYAEAYYNLGLLHAEIKNINESILYYSNAIKLNNNYIDAYKNRAIQYFINKQYQLSIKDYSKLKLLEPNKADEYDFLIFVNENSICNWKNYKNNLVKIKNNLSNCKINANYLTPWRILTIIDNPNYIKKSLTNYLIANYKTQDLKINFNIINRKKIRLAYYSPDFRNHAISHLIVNVLENHNKDDFEIYGFHFNKYSDDEMTKRISFSFDKFIRVKKNFDEEIIRISRDLGVDIAIDLCGITQDNRANIFINKVAPIQVNFLYPGGLGKYMDYIIADENLIPKNNQKFYFEKIVYMPDCYLPYDTKQNKISQNSNRKKFNIPESVFVYCCLNNVAKINPTIFNCWMKILKKTENTVLLLLSNENDCKENIIKEAKINGVSKERIIFTPFLDFNSIFERYKCCDLFLDTYPYNAHTTANEALSSELPLLTISGQYFHSRVATSLLKSLNMPELIKSNIKSYEEYAVYLGNNPEKLKELKKKLILSIKNSNTFKTQIYTKNLEKGYKEMYKRFRNNLLPDNIYI